MSTSKPEALWRIGDILWEDIKSDRRYTLPHSIKRVITRWMRECDQINMEGGSLQARENMINLMTALDLENPAHNKKFRAKVKEEVASYVRNTGVKFRGVQYQEDIITKKREWAPWTAKWLDDDWDGDIRPPQKERDNRLIDSVISSVEEVFQLPEEQVSQFVTRFFDAADKFWSQDIRRFARERYGATQSGEYEESPKKDGQLSSTLLLPTAPHDLNG